MSERELAGGCLCGAIKYTVHGPFLRFLHCHCARCRKVTGSAHATNLFVDAANLRFTVGESLPVRFDHPEAQRFGNSFCPRCGSRVPHLSKDGRHYLIPAGSLDDAPDIRPTGRIYFGSRAPWSCDGDDLPRFPEGPTNR